MGLSGIWNGAPFGVGYYIWKSLIPTTLGNMVGGGLFVGTAYWYLYLTGEQAISIDFDIGTLQSALAQGGGPMSPDRSGKPKGDAGDSDTIHGQDPAEHKASPRPVGMLMSGLGHELSDHSPYAKTHAERMRSQFSSDNKSGEKV